MLMLLRFIRGKWIIGLHGYQTHQVQSIGMLVLEKRLPIVVPLHDVIVPDFDLVLKLVDDGCSGPAAVQTLQKK